MKSVLSPVKNRLRYLVSYLWERAHGLDFTLPDRMYDRGRNDGAMYYPTARAVLEDVFSSIDTVAYGRFLDVGCGKGYVLKAAAEYGFRRVGGIEYDERLADICQTNLRRTGLQDRVRLVRGDAALFDGYGSYDCFYFFNPFKAEVMARVIAAICEQCRGRPVTLIYYHPRYPAPIEQAGCFRRTRVLRDTARDYEVYIYQGVADAAAGASGEKA